MNESQLQFRVLIPQHLRVGGVPAYEEAVRRLEVGGAKVHLLDALLKLTKSLPAVLEVEASRTCFDHFMANFPCIDQAVVSTQGVAAISALAAA